MRTALHSAISVDVVVIILMLAVAVVSDSLTLFGESARSAMSLIAALWALLSIGAGKRDAGRRYEFGAGKLEQAGNLIIAVVLLVAGLWVGALAIDAVVLGESRATPLGLAIAATVNALHATRRGLLLWRPLPTETSAASTPPRVHPMVSPYELPTLIVVQFALTVAALSTDPGIALGADCAGAIFLALLMTVAGVKMVWEAVLDLTDHPLSRQVEVTIARLLLEQGVDSRELVGMRSRRSGRRVFVELVIDPASDWTMEDLGRRVARTRHGVARMLDDLDLSIRLISQSASAYQAETIAGKNEE